MARCPELCRSCRCCGSSTKQCYGDGEANTQMRSHKCRAQALQCSVPCWLGQLPSWPPAPAAAPAASTHTPLPAEGGGHSRQTASLVCSHAMSENECWVGGATRHETTCVMIHITMGLHHAYIHKSAQPLLTSPCCAPAPKRVPLRVVRPLLPASSPPLLLPLLPPPPPAAAPSSSS
jgi:hypothetical protein